VTPVVSRGFRGRRDGGDPGRIPPGQYLERDFPVLSTGPTPRVDLATWTFSLTGALDVPRRWTWPELEALGAEEIVRDIHCVTKWSKLDTSWRGVPVDAVLAGVDLGAATHAMAKSVEGYTTNLPLADLTGGKAWLAYEYGGEPLAPEHGGPVRLLVPHLYLWKSAKWVTELELLTHDEQGVWEAGGYHDRGDPWLEQRYQGD
jgi:DMSO/TMAO reductase YedYZ molybdopterin-dependent catalytic subunit